MWSVEDTFLFFFRARRNRVRVPMAHDQKRRGQNTRPANHQKTRNPTPTPRKRGRARPQGTPHGRGDCNNRRTNARTSPEPRNHRRESPQKVGEKTCTVHIKAKRPKRREKTGKARKGTHYTTDGPQGRKGERCTGLSLEQQHRARDSKTEKGWREAEK